MRGPVGVVVRAPRVSESDESPPARGAQATSRCGGLPGHGPRRPRSAWAPASGSGSGSTAVHTAPPFLLVGLALGLAVAALQRRHADPQYL